ncbi:MAG: MiaB/RimO family radical SAM methylthiotransferase [Acetobacteraceae bacterium]|nr:MiaB/RimO family radical SAM methylthiotransferase [Acetobacteraceae bacterium]
MPAVAFYTLGCKVNQYDTAGLAALFSARGYRVVRPGEAADVCVINTCTVTARSQAKSRQAVRRACRLYPGAVVAVAGCGSEVFPQDFALPGVEVVAGVRDRRRLPDLVEAALAARAAGAGAARLPGAGAGPPHGGGEPPGGWGGLNPAAAEPVAADDGWWQGVPAAGGGGYREGRAGTGWPEGPAGCTAGSPRDFEEMPGGLVEGRTRGVLKVQEGCDQRCAYCLVPRARGPARSRRLAGALEEARALAARGCREVVVCGTHLGAYGRDGGGGREAEPLLELLSGLTRIPGLERVRLSSIEPMDVGPGLLEAVALWPRLCRHLHLPLQSGSDRVLRAMGRPYTSAQFRGLVERLRALNPEVAVTTDLMVGFPGESDDDFLLTLRLVEEVRPSRLHVFRFSARPGTPAACLPGRVPEAVSEGRSRRLIDLGSRLSLEFHRRYVGRQVEVLLEGRGGGFTSNYIWVRLRGPAGAAGRLCRALVAAADASGLAGEPETAAAGPGSGQG